MLKKILYWSMVIIITAGAVYSFQQVGFARKTAMFFQVWLGDGAAMGPGGGPQMGGQPGQRPEGGPQGGMPGQQASGTGEAARNNTPPAMGGGTQSGMQEGGNRGNAPPGGMKGGPPGGGYLSLRNVWNYTVLFAFFTMITQMLDQAVRKRSRKK